MSWDQKPNRHSRVQGTEGVLRHPDGCADIAAYAKLAHRERAAAIADSVRSIGQLLRRTLSAVFAVGGFPGKPGPVLAKDWLSTEK
jgi:hypothetical protein